MNLRNNQAGEPIAIGKTWPALPDSFKLRVTGAASIDGTLICSKAAGTFPSCQAGLRRAKLTSVHGWPTTDNWVDGLVDAVVSNDKGIGQDGTVSAILMRGSEYIVVDFKNSKVIFGPAPIGPGQADGHSARRLGNGRLDGAVYLQHNGTMSSTSITARKLPASPRSPRPSLNAIHRFDLAHGRQRGTRC